MSGSCNYVGCTVDTTRTCALERDPATCSNRNAAAEPATKAPVPDSAEVGAKTDIGAPVLDEPEATASFPASTTLGTQTIERMMATRYLTVVGILGEPDAGKTACLVSLYLLVSWGLLKGWSFADSRSLIGFEDIARGAREWNEGQPPVQLTLHTEMADERQPGFLHVRLKRRSDGRRVDFVVPDLPGEWTQSLMTSSDAERLEFIKAAEAVWLVVDGKALREKTLRQGVITRLGQLAGRIRTMTEGTPPRLLLVVTYRDMGELDPAVRDRLTAEIRKHGLDADIVEVAPFAANDGACKPGFGIEALIDATVTSGPESIPFWASRAPTPGQRNFISYRGDQ